MMVSPAYHRFTCFNRLPQGVQLMGWPFSQFIKKQNTTMGKANLTRFGTNTTANKRRD
jgi:hypothetical protein